MNRKKCLLFGFLILILIISLTSVHASENTSLSDDSITSIDDNIQSIESPGNGINEKQITQKYPNISNEKDTTEIISSSTLNSNHYVSGTSFSNIRSAANNSKPGDTITLNGTYHSDKKQITINTDNITIKGKSPNSKAILDGSDSETRILRINGDNVHLENLIFQNVHADIWGGTISSYGKHLTITNCEFINNNAQIGAIVLNNESHDTTIKNCIFKENGAIFTHNGTGGYGGAIDTHALNTQIINCTFTSNNALGGGAIYMLHHGNNTIKDCTFTNNTAKNGGAILQAKDNTNLNIINCNFTNNTAENNGGALYLNNETAIKNSIFNNNNANNYGGSVFSKGVVRINDSKFTNNNAKYGGSIYNKLILNLDNTIFKTNRALNGSAIYNSKHCNLTDCTFKDNQAKSYFLNSTNHTIKQGKTVKIEAYLEYGDNYQGIFDKEDLIVNNVVPNLSSGTPNEKIVLELEKKNYTAKTNKTGICIFKIPTKTIKIGKHTFKLIHTDSKIATGINGTGFIKILKDNSTHKDNKTTKKNKSKKKSKKTEKKKAINKKEKKIKNKIHKPRKTKNKKFNKKTKNKPAIEKENLKKIFVKLGKNFNKKDNKHITWYEKKINQGINWLNSPAISLGPNYKKTLDSWGWGGTVIACILDFGLGIDQNGNMSWADLILNIASLACGIGIGVKALITAGKILKRAKRLTNMLKGNKIVRLFKTHINTLKLLNNFLSFTSTGIGLLSNSFKTVSSFVLKQTVFKKYKKSAIVKGVSAFLSNPLRSSWSVVSFNFNKVKKNVNNIINTSKNIVSSLFNNFKLTNALKHTSKRRHNSSYSYNGRYRKKKAFKHLNIKQTVRKIVPKTVRKIGHKVVSYVKKGANKVKNFARRFKFW